MNPGRHSHHTHGRYLSVSYPATFSQELYSVVVLPILVLGIVFVVLHLFGSRQVSVSNITVGTILLGFLTSFVRLLVAFVFALVFSLPIALLITRSRLTERILLPVFDILQSVPVLAFFPIIILVFIRYRLLNEAAIFIIFLTMIWNIVFPLVGGLHTIPEDIKDMARVFKIKGRNYLSKILVPALVPYIVVGSLMAWAQAWNIIIVAEVLHTYVPGGGAGDDLFGIGSLLVGTSAGGQPQAFFYTICVLMAALIIINMLVWQRLLHYAERFKFD